MRKINRFCYRWSLIAGRLPGRTDNEIKNYWNTHIRRKLLTRGIDPATHRPMSEGSSAAQEATTTISFSGKEEVKNFDVLERCPDLNLELRISPPHQTQTGGRESCTLCFACSLGIQNSKDCSCSNDAAINGNTTNSGYDFLGLKTGVLDYRSLEMK